MTLAELLARSRVPVLYWHEQDGGPPTVAIVNVEWLNALWEEAKDDGHSCPFMPHDHTEPEDRQESIEAEAIYQTINKIGESVVRSETPQRGEDHAPDG